MDTVWLTYDELAVALRISPDSAAGLERSLSSTGIDIPSSRPTLGRAARASAVQEAAQRHWRKPARSVLDSGGTVLHSTGREGALHANTQRCFAKHGNLTTGKKSHQMPEEPPVDQQHMPDLPALAEAEIAPGGLVELVDVAQPHKVGAPRPGIQGLYALILVRRHERHGLNHVAPDQVVAPSRTRMGHGLRHHRDLVGEDEPVLVRMISAELSAKGRQIVAPDKARGMDLNGATGNQGRLKLEDGPVGISRTGDGGRNRLGGQKHNPVRGTTPPLARIDE